MDRYMIDGLVDAEVSKEAGCAFVALKTHDNRQIGLALPPQGMHQLALTFLQLLADGTKRGIFPQRLVPMMQPTTNLSATESGLGVEYDLSDGLRIVSEMPWQVAREFAEKLLLLCDEHDDGPSGLN